MIELVLLVLALGGIREVARKRGSSGWGFVVVGASSYVFVDFAAVITAGAGPSLLFRWAWIGLCYGSVFVLTQGGRRLRESWQCPECQLFNEPTTLFCPCGYKHPLAVEPIDSWQCPECQMFNDASTLACGCGYARSPSLEPSAALPSREP